MYVKSYKASNYYYNHFQYFTSQFIELLLVFKMINDTKSVFTLKRLYFTCIRTKNFQKRYFLTTKN